MKEIPKNVIPVLLGGDLNAYSVALSFREELGVTSHAFMRYRCGATDTSDFVKAHIEPNMDDVRVALSTLLKFAAEHNGAELFLIPCTDNYVEISQYLYPMLAGLYKIHLPDKNLWRELSDKCGFYSYMARYGILYPPYASFSVGEEFSENKLNSIDYPAVVKPSSSSEYWKNPFPDMRKVYFVENAGEAWGVIQKILASGYKKRVILQARVGGSEEHGVLTTFSDKRGRVVRAVYGDVILEERGKTSVGNHSAIITRPLNDICYRLMDFLSGVGYCGVANFDILTDGRTQYVLELNSRQGRSCDYLRAAGVSLARLFYCVANGKNIEPFFDYREAYWHYPPHRTVLKYSGARAAEELRAIYSKGADVTPYSNAYEGVLRRIYVQLHNMRLSGAIRRSMRGDL